MSKKAKAQSQMKQQTSIESGNGNKQYSIDTSGFELVPNNYCVWKLVRKIDTSAYKNERCPKCSARLYPDYTLIPITSAQKAKVNGRTCTKCQCLFVDPKLHVERLLQGNPRTYGFYLNGKDIYKEERLALTEEKRKADLEKCLKAEQQVREYIHQKKEQLRNTPSAVVMVCVQCEDRTLRDYTIVNDPKCTNPTKGVFHYTLEEAREFLSAAYAEARNKRGRYQEHSYRVLRTISPGYDPNRDTDSMIPALLLIRPDGGYTSSIINNKYELVDLLLYSPFKNRYELIRATHNKHTNKCFVDASIFRHYVRRFGNPGIKLRFESENDRRKKWDELNDESILKGYGYSVSKTDNHSNEYRQELLAEMVDLDILTVHRIVKLLSFFISSHPRGKDDAARMKWMMDKSFIENYKANPTRFLIATVKKA